MDLGRITLAAAMMSSIEMLPECWMFFTFFLSLGGLDDEGSGGGHHRAGGLSVLDLQLHRHLEAFPVLGGLGDVVTDLLGGQAEGAHLGGQGAGGPDLPSDSPQVDILHLSGVEFGSHGKCWWRSRAGG